MLYPGANKGYFHHFQRNKKLVFISREHISATSMCIILTYIQFVFIRVLILAPNELVYTYKECKAQLIQ